MKLHPNEVDLFVVDVLQKYNVIAEALGKAHVAALKTQFARQSPEVTVVNTAYKITVQATKSKVGDRLRVPGADGKLIDGIIVA
jgi:hypothetical protein